MLAWGSVRSYALLSVTMKAKHNLNIISCFQYVTIWYGKMLTKIESNWYGLQKTILVQFNL
jgi:hypothetical protein